MHPAMKTWYSRYSKLLSGANAILFGMFLQKHQKNSFDRQSEGCVLAA
jgi:hypothetical protein